MQRSTRLIGFAALGIILFTTFIGTAYYTSAASHRAHGKNATAVKTKPQPTASTSQGNGPWSLVFSDDFNGNQLNSQWITYGGVYSIGNSAWDPREITVSGGMAHIQIEKKTTSGKPYTSGGMGAMKLSQTYGKYEFRARLPRGKGVGPNAILWPQASGHGDVEVDLFESPPANKDKIYFTNHGNGQPSQIVTPGNFADAFHTFTYEWTPGKLDLQIDGVEKGSMTKNVPNFPMWLGLVVTSGDAFTGTPDNTTALPISLDVDWVHIYKYTGK
jgi:beta-glucanase (GH16 family)